MRCGSWGKLGDVNKGWWLSGEGGTMVVGGGDVVAARKDEVMTARESCMMAVGHWGIFFKVAGWTESYGDIRESWLRSRES